MCWFNLITLDVLVCSVWIVCCYVQIVCICWSVRMTVVAVHRKNDVKCLTKCLVCVDVHSARI